MSASTAVLSGSLGHFREELSPDELPSRGPLDPQKHAIPLSSLDLRRDPALHGTAGAELSSALSSARRQRLVRPPRSLDDHRAERGEFVRQLLEQAGIHPTHGPDDGPYRWERTAPTDPDVPPRPILLLQAIAERQRWKAEYTAAQLATGEPPDNRSATHDLAA